MILSKIISRMEEIVRTNVVLRQVDAVGDISSMLTRQELAVPLVNAYWLTHSDGTHLAFSDCIGGSSLANYCERNRNSMLKNGEWRGWKIDFVKNEITEIPINEFVHTIRELEKTTGVNEERITAGNDSELYLNSARFAYTQDELDVFDYSLQQNRRCSKLLFDYLNDLDFNGVIGQELASYSLERIVFVMAATVCNSEDKSSYGNDVVEWANRTLNDVPRSVIELNMDHRLLAIEKETISKYVRDSLLPLMEEAQANNNSEDNSNSEDIERY